MRLKTVPHRRWQKPQPLPPFGVVTAVASHCSRGFSLVEMIVALALMALLAALAAPAMGQWISGAQVRSVSNTLQDGVRLAQSEAVRRNRQVIFFLTNDTPNLTAQAVASGSNWVIRWIPLPGDALVAAAPDFEPFIQGGSMAESTNGIGVGVSIAGPAAICFNATGRRIAATAAATGVTGGLCTVDPLAPLATFDIAKTGARSLRVSVALGGQVRMCDPARTLSAAAPDGCPA